MSTTSTRLTLFDIQAILGRALSDPAFLSRLKAGQNETNDVLQQLGYELDTGPQGRTGQEVIWRIVSDQTFAAAAQVAAQTYNSAADGVIRPRCG
jgi:hypothetical protein